MPRPLPRLLPLVVLCLCLCIGAAVPAAHADPAATSCAAAGPGAAAIDPCDPLVDTFATVGQFTELTFGDGGIPPLPPDFFFPGSQPFAGSVALSGVPLEGGNGGDTAVARQGELVFAGNGYPRFSESLGIEVLDLALSSVEPLTVTGADGETEEWLMAVNPSGRQPAGSMTARLDSPEGGVFDATLPVLPVLTFARLADLQDGGGRIEVRTLDFGQLGLPAIELNFTQVPFSTLPAPNDPCPEGDFFPGVLPGGGGPVIISTSEPFLPVRHVFEPPKPVKKQCNYAHASSTSSTTPPCRPACPAGAAPFKQGACQTVADCPPFKVRAVRCTQQGGCLEVYAVTGCS